MSQLSQFRIEKAEMIIASGPTDHNPVRVQLAPAFSHYDDKHVYPAMFHGREQNIAVKTWAVLRIDWDQLIDRFVTTMIDGREYLVTAKSTRPGTSYVVNVRKIEE